MTLLDEVREYVNKSHANAWLRAAGAVPDEPGLVSSFLSKEMYRGLRQSLQRHARPGTNTLVRGIFTHQTPKVRLVHRRRSVEIADLMLVHQHFSRNWRTPTSGRALLFQAKRTSTPSTGSVAAGTQATQFELYRDWAKFVGSTRLPVSPKGFRSWDFCAGGRVSQANAVAAGEYMTVFDQHAFSVTAAIPQWAAPISCGPAHSVLAGSYPATCTWSAGGAPLPGSSPSRGVNCPVDFGTVFTDFLGGSRGRPYIPDVSNRSDHWSIFVNKMLSISARPNGNYVYTSKKQNIASGLRGRNLIAALWHAVEEEVECFLSGVDPHDGSGFAITNSLLDRVIKSELDVPNDFPPDNLAHEFLGPPGGGHVPMLLILTVERDGPVFRGDSNG